MPILDTILTDLRRICVYHFYMAGDQRERHDHWGRLGAQTLASKALWSAWSHEDAGYALLEAIDNRQ